MQTGLQDRRASRDDLCRWSVEIEDLGRAQRLDPRIEADVERVDDHAGHDGLRERSDVASVTQK